MGILSYEIIVFFVNIVLLFSYLRLSHRYHWFDLPDEKRKIHETAKPTSAGLIFMLPIVLSYFLFEPFYYLNAYTVGIGLVVLLVLGALDDFKPVSVAFRLLTVFMLCAYFLYALFYDNNSPNLFVMLFYLFGMVWWINLFNFMDGADGMAGLHAFVTAVAYGVAFVLLDYSSFSFILLLYILLFVLCILSFLLFNFPVSRMFMGDSGSLSVAFILASFALYGVSIGVFDEILVISFHLVFIVDATLTLLTRIKFKHKIAQAHNLHMFQAMIHQGYSHAQTSLLYALVTAVNCVLALCFDVLQFDFTVRLMVLSVQVVILSFLWFNFHNKTKFKRFLI